MRHDVVLKGVALAALAVSACQPPAGSAPEPAPAVDVGSVSFALTLGGGFKIATVSYDISGNGFHRAADISVANSATFETVVGGIPAGHGYTATLAVQDTDHRLLPCHGSSTFDVAAAATAAVDVHLACRVAPTSSPPLVPVPRSASLVLGALLLALGCWRARRAAGPAALTLVAAVSLAVATTGCDAGPAASTAALGAVTMALDVAPGSTLNAVDYQLTGPGSFMRSGTIDVSHSAGLSATLGALPPGMGFQLELRATSVDGNTRCLGTAGFDIAARATTNVIVHVLCQQMGRNGTAAVNGALNACPLIDGVGASPGELTVGNSLALSATAHDLDGAPAPLTFHWTTTSGTLSDAAAPNPRLTCTSAGPATVTVAVSDGDLTPGCPDTQAISVSCAAAPGGGQP